MPREAGNPQRWERRAVSATPRLSLWLDFAELSHDPHTLQGPCPAQGGSHKELPTRAGPGQKGCVWHLQGQSPFVIPHSRPCHSSGRTQVMLQQGQESGDYCGLQLDSSWTQVESYLFCFLALRPGASFLTSLCLSYSIWKMRLLMYLICFGCLTRATLQSRSA